MMKRIKFITLILVVGIFVAISNITFAYNDYCQLTEDGQHDYTYINDKTNAHPHKGYRECFCGKRVYYENSYFDECVKCRKELCKEGVHYYLADIHYNDLFSGYGKCYCGNKKYFSSYNGGRNWYEPYPGMISIIYRGNWEIFVEAKHPHREYDPYSGTLYYKEDIATNIGNCGVCNLQDEYYKEVEQYEINTILYKNDEYYHGKVSSSIYEDEEYYYHKYEDHENESDIYVDYSEYKEDYDFYEWLELAKEILNN